MYGMKRGQATKYDSIAADLLNNGSDIVLGKLPKPLNVKVSAGKTPT